MLRFLRTHCYSGKGEVFVHWRGLPRLYKTYVPLVRYVVCWAPLHSELYWRPSKVICQRCTSNSKFAWGLDISLTRSSASFRFHIATARDRIKKKKKLGRQVVERVKLATTSSIAGEELFHCVICDKRRTTWRVLRARSCRGGRRVTIACARRYCAKKEKKKRKTLLSWYFVRSPRCISQRAPLTSLLLYFRARLNGIFGTHVRNTRDCGFFHRRKCP